jgi:hypothetical protein
MRRQLQLLQRVKVARVVAAVAVELKTRPLAETARMAQREVTVN